MSRRTQRQEVGPRRGAPALIAALSFTALTGLSRLASAGQDDVVLMPTVVPVATTPSELPELRRPDPEDQSALARWARQLDAIVTEAVQDLGLQLDVSVRSAADERSLSEDALVTRATESWVISPRLELAGNRLRVRIVAVAPGAKVLLVRSQELTPREVPIRALVMTRDIVQAGRRAPDELTTGAPESPAAAPPLVMPARSAGRAVLALNSAAFGGYVGLSLQRASGSEDERLTYPLIALGTGIGLGASMIVADEWDVGLGDAWFLSAGAWWPTAAGFLLADGYGVEPKDDRFVYGLVGAAGGMALATTALTFKGVGEGSATLTHSGGAFGLLIGGMAELGVEGRTDITPSKGMGYGTGLGVLVAGAVATQVHVASSRVLLLDLGTMLGALTGAAAASPLVFQDEHTKGKDRAWLASVGGGMLAGGLVAYWLTEPSGSGHSSSRAPTLLPYAGVLGRSTASDGRDEPIYGGGVQGLW
jgi:hypothetical protein